jgi:hypothetical protein
MAATVLVMFLSVSCMLVVGLTSNSQSPAQSRPATQLTHSSPVRTNHGGQFGALRARVTRWVAYFARSG